MRKYYSQNYIYSSIPFIFFVCSVFLYSVSLSQDSIYLEGGQQNTSGLFLLLFGWIGLLIGYYAWIANPLLLVSWLSFLFNSYSIGSMASIGSVVFMFSFLMINTMPSIETSIKYQITGYGPGYWLWVASAVCSVAANLIALGSWWRCIGLMKRDIK
ncbi:hypothetical protein [Chlorobium ferrooxidans]|uniref:hypothetical protein n=1 Tax=Chlorobium ferrooxidans TaxID=84205 RepID=UPI0012E9A576|nr:hypothetical protein [Chlorobium ferrooxidans]